MANFGRAPIIFEDECKPLRTPNSQPHVQSSKLLSPLAREFVPQGRNYASSNDVYGVQHQPSMSNYPSYSNGYQQTTSHYHLQHHQQQQQHIYQQQQQQQHQAQQQQQQQHIYQPQQQQPQQQQLAQQQQQQQQQMQMSTKSVQDRLNPTFYGQYVQQQQHPLHQQRQQLAQHHQRENNHARYQHHHQNHDNHHNHQHQNEHHHHHHHEHGHSNDSKSPDDQSSTSSSSVETNALDYLKTVMQCLNQNPGQYDTVATRFLNVFEGMENNEYVLANAMEDIFEESIQNPNFRYMGAKLYNLLHMLNPKPDSFFNMLLKCKLDDHQQQVADYLEARQLKKVHQTALFLAELYMQLTVDGEEQQRIQLIAENIIFSLKQLLNATLADNLPSNDAAENVRCICMTLKLAGYDLTTDCGADIAQIIAQLEAINAQAPDKYPMAANVISLQKNNWGRKPSNSAYHSSGDEFHGASGEPSRQNEILRISDEPIFYGPDGRELTAEEAEFLANGMAPDSATDDDEDPATADNDVEFDLEMDEETAKDYKAFCKLNHK